MLYRALKSFGGIAISMAAGTVAEINDRAIADDLMNAGYIEPIGNEPNEEQPEPKPKKTATKKGGKGK